jgi:hypothetical protein
MVAQYCRSHMSARAMRRAHASAHKSSICLDRLSRRGDIANPANLGARAAESGQLSNLLVVGWLMDHHNREARTTVERDRASWAVVRLIASWESLCTSSSLIRFSD